VQKGLSLLCGLFGNGRQAYYQYKRHSAIRRIHEHTLLTSVNEIRSEAPRIGGLKLYIILCQIYGRSRMMGRDSFLNLLRRYHLMLMPRKSRSTTDSNHRFHKYKNLIKGLSVNGINQLWVSDITYIELQDSVCYLHIVTDAYSHKIVGWELAPGLHSAYTIQALKMAISDSGKEDLSGLIHHSDRGVQYCCDAYVKCLNDHHITISMTEDYKPTDNGIAERVNGIIKDEWLRNMNKFTDIEEARSEMERIITFYNDRRPHMSNDMLTPNEAHAGDGELKKRWKKKNYKRKEEVLPINT
jgi:transposase InsO family protein